MAEATKDGYADALRREIIRSEQQRVRALAIILGVPLASTVTGSIVLIDLTHRLFRHGINPLMPLGAIGPFFVYEVVVLRILKWRGARDTDFPRYGRFTNALVDKTAIAKHSSAIMVR